MPYVRIKRDGNVIDQPPNTSTFLNDTIIDFPPAESATTYTIEVMADGSGGAIQQARLGVMIVKR